MSVLVQAVTSRCPCCRDNVSTQREAYIYARAYLCDFHRSMWDAADEHAHAREKGCPHRPGPCRLNCTPPPPQFLFEPTAPALRAEERTAV